MNWLDASECVMGLILEGRLSHNSVRPEILIEPYNRMLTLWKEGLPREEIIQRVGLQPFNACLSAVHSMNGAGEADWVKILEESYTLYQAGRRMERWAKRLVSGEQIDWGEYNSLGKVAQQRLAESLIPLSQIESGEVPFILTGMKSFDDHTGGIPAVGLIVVGSRPGMGKTSFMIQIVSSFAREHPAKNIAVFSLEMVFQEIAARFRAINRLTNDLEERIFICEKPMRADEIIATASTVENLGLVAIDFADLMIQGETNESSMAEIYRTLMLGAKALHVPILLLSQLNRSSNGLPRPSEIRWTGLAEALAWMILTLYNPNLDWSAEEDSKETGLPVIKDVAYIAVWKVRGGFRKHLDACPGAIQIPFRGDKGWHPTQSHWFSLSKVS